MRKDRPYGNYKLEGVGPDEETIVNEKGASQSKCDTYYLGLPPLALHAVSKLLQTGAEKYGKWNWTAIERDQHLEHAQRHLAAWCAGDTQEGEPLEHLLHFVCRALFALDVELRGEQDAVKTLSL